MTGMWGPLGLIGGAVLRGAGCGTGVLLLVHPSAGVLWWLIGCWLMYQAGVALTAAALPPTARARDRAARVRLLRAVERLGAVQRLGADPGRPDPGPLRDHVYAAAGVAIRWEPKPGAAVAVLAHLTGSLLTLTGLAAALAVVDPALAAGVGLCVALALGLVLRPRGRRAGATGRAGWDARRRASRTVAVLVGVLAAGAALLPLLAAARRPDAAVGLCSAAVLLARFVYGLTAVDLTALRHRRVTRRHLREVERAAVPEGGGPGAAPAGIVVVPARPGRLGFADLAENVHLGALGPDESVPERLPRTVRLCHLDALAQSLPRGWRTVPSAEFSGGVDLDEEAWRRIAAARVSALLERGATEVLLPGEPDPFLAAVLADWSSRAGVRVRVLAGPEGAAPGGAVPEGPEGSTPGGALPEGAAW
ncbi:hypothetical protein [Streptomyces platensis]|uniref:hypothetical protein n=1 Tax=Streptomyces platensis TaxID=58346 RepID=UPI001F3FA7AE|nr:hypothetical protein [Streptomyces platensis]MCF3141687.1 hypothetical protein [Streptomyces platensis]